MSHIATILWQNHALAHYWGEDRSDGAGTHSEFTNGYARNDAGRVMQ